MTNHNFEEEKYELFSILQIKPLLNIPIEWFDSVPNDNDNDNDENVEMLEDNEPQKWYQSILEYSWENPFFLNQCFKMKSFPLKMALE